MTSQQSRALILVAIMVISGVTLFLSGAGVAAGQEPRTNTASATVTPTSPISSLETTTLPSTSQTQTTSVSIDENTTTGGISVTIETAGTFDTVVVETNDTSVEIAASAGNSVLVPNSGSQVTVFGVNETGRTLLRTYQPSFSLLAAGATTAYNSGPHPDGSVTKPKYVERRGGYAFVAFQANPGYIVAYDVSNSTNPVVADTVNVAGGGVNGGYALSLRNETLFVSQNGGSFTSVDVSDPTNMSVLAYESTGGQGFDIATKGDYVYIADAGGALRVFDVSDPANPTQVTTRSVTAGGVSISGEHLYVTDYPNNQLRVYDVSSPAAPSEIGTYRTSFGFPVPVDVAGDYAYVQEYTGSQIDVVDISDPANPSKVTTITTPEQIPNGGAIQVAGGNLYLTTGQTGNAHVTIYSTDDFSTPIVDHAVSGAPAIGAGDVWGTYVYLPNNTNRSLTVLNVADGAAPEIERATTGDTDGNGKLDRLTVTFTESITASSVEAADYNITGYSGEAIASGNDGDDTLVFSFTENESTDTGATPPLSYSKSGGTDTEDSAGNAMANQTFTGTIDGAGPQVTGVATADTDRDGTIEQVNVTLSEPIDDEASTLDGSTFDGISGLGGATDDPATTGDTPNDTKIVVPLSGAPSGDTSLTGSISLAANQLSDGITSNADQNTISISDGTPPVVNSITTLDRDGDGNVDAANVTFSEPVNDSTFSPEMWSIGGQAVDDVNTTADGITPINDGKLQLQIDTDANEASGTDATDVTYTPGTAADMNGVALTQLQSGDVSEIDGAAPVLSGSRPTTRNVGQTSFDIVVNASESGIGHYVVVPNSSTAPSASQVTAGQNGNGTTALRTGSIVVGTPTAEFTDTVSGLNRGTSYDLYVVAEDAAGNLQASPSKRTITTASSGGGGGGGDDDDTDDCSDDSSELTVSTIDESVTGRLDCSGTTTFELPTESLISTVEVDLQSSGVVATTAVGNLSMDEPQPTGGMLAAVDIDVRDTTSDLVTIRLTVPSSTVDEMGARPSNLVIEHQTDNGTWTTLQTTVSSQDSDQVTVEAEVTDFSLYAVTTHQQTTPTTTPATTEHPETTTTSPTRTVTSSPETTTTNPTRTATLSPETGTSLSNSTPTQSSTSTGADAPGFGLVVGVIALIVVALLAVRRER